VAVVQNGIIENYRELRELKQLGHELLGYRYRSYPHLIAEFLSKPHPFLEAVRQTVNKLQGAFAIAVICADYPDELIIARQQAPNDWFWSGRTCLDTPRPCSPYPCGTDARKWRTSA